ncbi:MAG: hypothetical protein D6788_06540 [Planctomycetota bacterium]|nr:MAG: hypothetical protein D6788_06540 [Planctomycetota bacterium]
MGGFYRIEPATLLEEVVGLATMRGQLDPVDPKTFNPSARSMACTKRLWERAGGWPEWIRFSEDTLFDHKLRAMGSGWRFVPDAIVSWRPRSSLRSIARQFYNYGTGRGHTQIDAPAFRYNLRNALLLWASVVVGLVTPWAWIAVASLFAYFYVFAFHAKARRIARRTGRPIAYPLSLAVIWLVMFAHLGGYLVGSYQRWRRRDRFRDRMEAYLAIP